MRWILLLALWSGAALRMGASEAPGPLPEWTAGEIIERFIERVRTAPERGTDPALAYDRRTVVEELDRRGEVTERRVKEHRVELHGGRQTVRLVRIDGRSLSPREEAAERRREEDNRRRFAARGDRARSGGRDFIDEKLIRLFRYELAGIEEVDGRMAYVLDFVPADPRDEGSIADRILVRLTGRIWIDVEEFELVSVDARLVRPLPVLGSLAGSLDDLGFRLARRRLPDGIWVNTVLGSHASGRKVVVPFRVRMTVEEDGFRRVPSP